MSNKKFNGKKNKRGRSKSTWEFANQNRSDDSSTSRNTGGAKPKVRDGHHPSIGDPSDVNNDTSWYTNFPGLPTDYASIPMNVITGRTYDPLSHATCFARVAGSATTAHLPNKTTSAFAMPTADAGIMAFSVAPVLGDDIAANRAADQLYSMVRQKNSGAANYDKTDLMMYILAMDSAYMVYEHWLRVYRTFVSYNYLNAYLPDALLQTMGVSPKLASQYKDLKGALDLYAVRLGAKPVPNQFDFIKRHSWLFSNVYVDEADNGRAQMYLMVPDCYLKWVEGKDDNPTNLQYISPNAYVGPEDADLYTSIDEVQALFDAILSPIEGSGDVAIIIGDLLKAFEEGGMITIDMPKDFDPLTLAHDDEVLTQLQNAEWTGMSFTSGYDTAIKQDLSDLSFGPKLTQNLAWHNPSSATMLTDIWASFNNNAYNVMGSYTNIAFHQSSKSLLSLHDDTSPEYILAATRFKFNVTTSADANNFHAAVVDHGTEVITHVLIVGYDINGQVRGSLVYQHVLPTVGVTMPSLQTLLQRTRFRYRPPMFYWTREDDDITFWGYDNDNDKIQWLSPDQVRQMNRVCVMSEYAPKGWTNQAK